MTALRDPDVVMRLDRLGSAHQTRLSFMRVLLRQLRRGDWRFDRPVWDIDARGVGRAVYRAIGPDHTYSLVAFAHDLPDHLRSDRVIAEAWDATFALFDGTPGTADLDRLEAEVPRQEAGRVSDTELVLSRANRSTRLWAHVIERLAQGQQPDAARIAEVGYLMRTTAVYGSGKFGAADRAVLTDRPVMDGPFRAEMLAVWLIRSFSLDLVEHMARARGGDLAAVLDPDLRRRFGIGNSTGLGMAPFLVNHPRLLHAWIAARETALARVRALPRAEDVAQALFRDRLDRTATGLNDWQTSHPVQLARLGDLRADTARLTAHVEAGALDGPVSWDRLWRWAEATLTAEGQELTLSLMLEPHGDLIDDLADQMGCDEEACFAIDGGQTVAAARAALPERYGWALGTDFGEKDRCARFWYVSEAKLEPRLGERHDEPGADLELPLDIARAAVAMAEELAHWPGDATLAEVLLASPEHRRMARRLQVATEAPYSEIRDNLIDAATLPIDMLRCKLAFFGATRFDPRSDRWVRITMYQNAPFPDDLHLAPEDDWTCPDLSRPAA